MLKSRILDNVKLSEYKNLDIIRKKEYTQSLFKAFKKGVPQDMVPGFSPETRRSQGGNLRFTVGFSVHAKLAQ